MSEDDEVTSNLTIRALPARVRKTLAVRAKARHQSLNSYVVERLTLDADTPTMADWMAELDAFRSPTGVTGDDVVAAIREVREEQSAKWD